MLGGKLLRDGRVKRVYVFADLMFTAAATTTVLHAR
jgi:hypothetical protein